MVLSQDIRRDDSVMDGPSMILKCLRLPMTIYQICAGSEADMSYRLGMP
jgi:hypothetical protein